MSRARRQQEPGTGFAVRGEALEQHLGREPPAPVGQHRLVHPPVLDREVEAACAGGEDLVGVER